MLIDLEAELKRFGIPCRGVIQVGAHDGQEAARFAAMGFGAIHLIEPNPPAFARLTTNTRSLPNVTLAQLALSDTNGRATLTVTSDDRSSSLLELKAHRDLYPGIIPRTQITVETRTLDDHLRSEAIDGRVYNVLCADTQGAELKILNGSERYLANCDAVLLEVSRAELYRDSPQIRDIDAFLFDRGFVRVRTALLSRYWGDALYVRSERVADPFALLQEKRMGIVQVPRLGKDGRLANQLFQYAFAYFYALRTGCEMRVRDWRSRKFFRIPKARPPANLPVLELVTGNRDQLGFLRLSRPARNLGFKGYFQDLPESVRRHRQLFRRLFLFQPGLQSALDDWIAAISRSGTRPVIAAHVRRGDYLEQTPGQNAHARIPTAWFEEALRRELSERPEAYVHISSDDPAVGPAIMRALGRADQEMPHCRAPDHIRDFYALAQAHISLLSNSSFSHMAALLAREGQRALIVNPDGRTFEPYDAWADEDFWRRFVPPDDRRRNSVFTSNQTPEETERVAAAMVCAADRLWRKNHPLAYWRRTTGAHWLAVLRRLFAVRRRRDFLALATLKDHRRAVSRYWEVLENGDCPDTLPASRFFELP